MSKIVLKMAEGNNPYAFEVVYSDGKVLRYFVPAGQDTNLPVEAGCFVRFSLIPLDFVSDESVSEDK